MGPMNSPQQACSVSNNSLVLEVQLQQLKCNWRIYSEAYDTLYIILHGTDAAKACAVAPSPSLTAGEMLRDINNELEHLNKSLVELTCKLQNAVGNIKLLA